MKKLLITLLLPTLLLLACETEDDSVNSSAVEASNESSNESKYTATEVFVAKNNANLTSKEVQYDMPNKLDKNFYVEGIVTMCDYYNYGFTNESAFFCGKIHPTDGSDSWHLYFHRETFTTLYEYLLETNVSLRVSAQVPSKAYKRGQGNMATVTAIEAY